MKHKIFFLFLLMLMYTGGALGADILTGYVLLNGEQVEAEYTKLSANTVALGTGHNACVSQYSEGRLMVPGKVTINGTTYNVTSIEALAFRLCTKLSFVEIQEGVTRIGDFAFIGCTGLTEVALPASLASIGSGAFINLRNIRSILLAGTTPPTWEYNDVFYFKEGGIGDANPQYVGSSTNVSVPEDAIDTYRSAFYSDVTIGWTTPDGWGYFTSYNNEYAHNYRIYTPEDLEYLREILDITDVADDMKIISLEADVDMTDRTPWTTGLAPWIDYPFTGIIEGHNHTIKGLTIEGRNNSQTVGLVDVFKGDTIRNLRLVDCTFKGMVAGSVIGTTLSDVCLENVYSDCTVRGTYRAGGLVGNAYLQTLDIRNCVFAGSVGLEESGTTYSDASVGGFSGCQTWGTIRTSAVTGIVADARTNYCAPFVGYAAPLQYQGCVSVDSCYCAATGYADYAPSIYTDRIQLGSHCVISGRDGYYYYWVGSPVYHSYGEMAGSGGNDVTNMQTFFMAGDLGTNAWIYKWGEYPLPASMADRWPVEKNEFILCPPSMVPERVNGLCVTDTDVPASAWHSRLEEGDDRSFHYRNLQASRLWFDENVSPNVMDRPWVLPLGLGNIAVTDGIEYTRELRAQDMGLKYIEEPEYEIGTDGEIVEDSEGNPIETGNVIEIEDGREFKPMGYTVYLPYELQLAPYCKLYQPLNVKQEDGATTITFGQVADNYIHAFTPYYIVVEADTISLSTEAETVCPPVADTNITLGNLEFVGTNKFVSNYDAAHEGAYILQSDGRWHRVVDYSNENPDAHNATIPAFRAYFRSASHSAKSLGMTLDDGSEATAITLLRTLDLDGTEHYYDLFGRRLPSPTRGINIHNGRKVVIK